MIETQQGYDALAMAVIEKAYDDLVNSYKTILAVKYPNHSENTRIKSKSRSSESYKRYKYNSAVFMKNDCLRFFLTSDFDFYMRCSNISGSAFVKRAKKDAVEWFRDRDKLQKIKETKRLEKVKKLSIKRRKRKDKKHGQIKA